MWHASVVFHFVRYLAAHGFPAALSRAFVTRQCRRAQVNDVRFVVVVAAIAVPDFVLLI